jgi:high-affinity iron transporter
MNWPLVHTFYKSGALLRACVLLITLIWMAAMSSSAGASTGDEEKAQTVVHMLDYVGVDYPEFVQDGKVMNEEEY